MNNIERSLLKDRSNSKVNGSVYIGFQGENEHTENNHLREARTPLPINDEDDTRDEETVEYEKCAISYQFTNLTFLRLIVMILLASFAVFSIMYLALPLAQERGTSDVTAPLTVTVCGATGLDDTAFTDFEHLGNL